MGDPTDPITLTVTVNGQQMSLSDYLKMADDALAVATHIPDNATVTLTDGTVESGAAYKAQVEEYHSQAYQDANNYLDKVQAEMKVSVDALGSLADHLHTKGDAVTKLLGELQADLHGWEAAVGTDDVGKQFLAQARQAMQDLYTDVQTLAKSHKNLGDGVADCHTTTAACVRNTLAAFGR